MNRRHQRTARYLVLIALVLEVQSPMVGGGVRLAVVGFVLFSAILLLANVRAAIENLSLLASWPLAALLAYCLWCSLSAFWSVRPSESLLQSGLLMLGLLIAIAAAGAPQEILAREFVRVVTWLSVMSWAMVVLVPGIAVVAGSTWRLSGPMQNSQRLALVTGAAFLLVLALRHAGVKVFASRQREVLALALLAVTLLATQTRANTVFVVVAALTIYYFRARPWQKVLLVGTGLAAISWIIYHFAAIMAAFDREGSETATLTGRTTIWENTLRLIDLEPWIGYGFGAFYSNPLTSYFFSDYIAPHAHNMWLNAAFETGWTGAGLLTLFFVGGILSRGGSLRANRYVWPLLVFVALCGLTGVVFGGKVGTLWLVVVGMVAQATLARRTSARASAALKSARGPRRR